LHFAGIGGAAHATGRVTGIIACFTVAAATLYALAFLAILGYRLDRNQIKNLATE